jgi:outer membrane protein OmpA-like peptidoglycan-associated protein
MRQSIIIFSLLLVAWIAGSSYWYVCRIRCDCRQDVENVIPVSQENAGDITAETEVTPEQTLMASIKEAESYLKNAGTLTLYFGPNKETTETVTVPDEYLKKLKLYLDNKPESGVMVSGHADKSGSKSENLQLSKSRAEFVKVFLVKSGINTNQIQTSYKSDNEPLTSNDTPEERSRNRRAEINFLN